MGGAPEEEDENCTSSAAPVALSQLVLGHASDAGALLESHGLRRAKCAWDAEDVEDEVRRILGSGCKTSGVFSL